MENVLPGWNSHVYQLFVETLLLLINPYLISNKTIKIIKIEKKKMILSESIYVNYISMLMHVLILLVLPVSASCNVKKKYVQISSLCNKTFPKLHLPHPSLSESKARLTHHFSVQKLILWCL